MSIWRLGVLFEYRYHVLVSGQFCFKNGKSTVLAVESVLEQNLNYFELRQSMILCDLSQTRMYIVDCKPYDTHNMILCEIQVCDSNSHALNLHVLIQIHDTLQNPFT